MIGDYEKLCEWVHSYLVAESNFSELRSGDPFCSSMVLNRFNEIQMKPSFNVVLFPLISSNFV